MHCKTETFNLKISKTYKVLFTKKKACVKILNEEPKMYKNVQHKCLYKVTQYSTL